jgi:Fe-S oxidoreductase
MSNVFAPGCALLLHKPVLAERLQAFLNEEAEAVPEHLTCCHHEPGLPPGTQVINVCPGCDRRYRELYPGISTISLWELLAGSETFPFPDYGGVTMAILDACPTRTEARVHLAIRSLLSRMNIRIAEPAHTQTKATCCGDSFYGVLPVAEVKTLMGQRAGEMPCQDVVVYCVSCVKAMHIGGRTPRYLVDLLFGEATPVGIFEPDDWHGQIQAFIDTH